MLLASEDLYRVWRGVLHEENEILSGAVQGLLCTLSVTQMVILPGPQGYMAGKWASYAPVICAHCPTASTGWGSDRWMPRILQAHQCALPRLDLPVQATFQPETHTAVKLTPWL